MAKSPIEYYCPECYRIETELAMQALHTLDIECPGCHKKKLSDYRKMEYLADEYDYMRGLLDSDEYYK